jgi:hypothetical protein
MKSIYLIIFTLFVTFIAGSAAPARAGDVFTVNNVEVSGQGASANAAKDNAIAAGEEYAFKKLLQSITVSSSEESWPKLTPEELADLVQGFDIQKEKVTAKHYEATLNISFNQALVEKLLKIAKISYVAKGGEPIIVLPLYINASGNMLWESQNIWLNAWRKTVANNGFTQVTIPKGDIKDREAASPEKLLTSGFPIEQKDKDIISGFMNKYFSKKLLVVKASKIEQNGIIELSVELTYLINDQPENSSLKFKGNPGETVDVVMEKAASEIIGKIGAKWKQAQAASQANSSQVNVNVPIANMAEWNALKAQLESFDFIKSINTKYLTVSYASVDISFNGSQYDLFSKLESRGLYIEQKDNGLYLTKSPPVGGAHGWLNKIQASPEPDPVPEGWKPNDPEEPRGKKVDDNDL